MSFRDGLSGAAAGVVSKVAVAPIDMVKVYVQTHKCKNIYTVPSTIYRSCGIRGFYRGLPLNSSRAFVMMFSRFCTAEKLREQYGMLLGAVMCAIIQSLISHPIENLRQRTMDNLKKVSSQSIIRDLWSNGTLISGLYKGLTPSCCISILYVTTEFTVYDTIKKRDMSPFISGSVASMCAQTVIFPLDAYMRRIISGTSRGSFLSLYRGVGINVIRVLPTGGIHYTVYEQLRSI